VMGRIPLLRGSARCRSAKLGRSDAGSSVACLTSARTMSYIKRLWFARPASRGGLLCGRAFVRRPLSRPRYDPAVHPPKSG
jgi:hypothetical protein